MEELATGYGLIEGPVWHDEHGLIFADVMNGGVRALSEVGDLREIVPKRRGIGGMALHATGGLVLGGREIIHQDENGSPPRVLIDNDVTDVAIGFNDLTTDREGRVWAGSLAFRVFAGEAIRPGHLHVVDLDGSVRTVSEGITLTNGMGFSPDGKQLYHCDSRSDVIRKYDVTSDAAVSGWQPLTHIEGEGIPDGMAVAQDGSIWVAIAHGSKVAVFEPDGRLREEYPVPLPMVTSVCFGGKDLQDLYVVTGSHGGPTQNCGTVYRMRAPVPGLPLSPAKV